MRLFLIVSEIGAYGRKVSKWWKIRMFEFFGPPCGNALADLDGSTPECAHVCGLHIEPHLEALKKIEIVSLVVHCTNETTYIFWVFNSPSTCPQGLMDPRGGRGTSADIAPKHIKFGVDPSTRCWDIAQKPKCKNSPLTPIVTKISFPLPPGAANPQEGRRHIRNQTTRVRPHATYSKTNTSPFAR